MKSFCCVLFLTCSMLLSSCASISRVSTFVPCTNSICQKCQGNKNYRCHKCLGRGHQVCTNCHGRTVIKCYCKKNSDCKRCNNSGFVQCRTCNGSSTISCRDCRGRGMINCGKFLLHWSCRECGERFDYAASKCTKCGAK